MQTPEERREYKKAWKEEHKERLQAERKAYYQANKELYKARDKLQRQRHSDRLKDYRLRKKYGITLEVFKEMLRTQGDGCVICSKPQTEGPRGRLCVDHDHKTNKIRGLLCHSCNRGVGLLQDNSEILLRAVDYLKGSV